MNHPIQPFKALLRRSFYTHEVRDEKVFDEVYVFGIQSLEGHILMFHVMTSFGMLRSRVPLSELFWKIPTDESFQFKPTDKVLWNCFSTVNCEVVNYPYLEGIRAKVTMRNKKEVWASYLFTVDWYDNGFSDEPDEYKCLHVLKEDGGSLMGQPNNRIVWREPSFVCDEFPINKGDIKVDKSLISVENESRWFSDKFYYDENE
jgi:hypothetical protein